MCNNMDRYLSRPNAGNILLLSPTFEDACRDCATDSAWLSAWSIMALVDVIGHSIKTHYPPMYGKGHLAYQTINTTYSPCETEAKRTIAIMWTNTQWGVKGLWNPNHFIPVTATLSTDQMFQPAYHSSPIHAKIKVESTMDTSTVKEESLSEEPEHEPSLIDASMQYQNTE